MLKSKDRRDTFLLVFMAVIIILFLIYLFIPLSEKTVPVETGIPTTPPAVVGDPTPTGSTPASTATEASPLEPYQREIAAAIEEILIHIQGEEEPFSTYPVEALTRVLSRETLNERFGASETTGNWVDELSSLVEKYRRLEFYDLGDLVKADFPEACDARLRFGIYLSLFLVKARGHAVLREMDDLPDAMLERVLDLSPYHWLGNELEEDYQTLPLLFYFNVIVRRLNPYATEDRWGFFRRGLEGMKDLTPRKTCNRIRDLLSFSRQDKSYRVSWIERDSLNPDDRGVFNGVVLPTYDFLKQCYLVLPVPGDARSNHWIQALCETDAGDIELVSLQIVPEELGETGMARAIHFDPERSRFVVVFRACNFALEHDVIRTLLAHRMQVLQSRLGSVDLLTVSERDDAYEEELIAFGHHLKKMVCPVLKPRSVE